MDTRRTQTADWNITGLGTGPNGWVGKYKIPDEEYEAFLQLAHDHAFVRGRAHTLLEKHKPQSPILIDLDFKYVAGGPLSRRFTPEQLRAFVAAYADAFEAQHVGTGDLSDMSDDEQRQVVQALIAALVQA